MHVLLKDKKARGESWLVSQAKLTDVQVYGLSGYFIRSENLAEQEAFGGEPTDSDESRHRELYGSTVILGYARLDEAQIREGVARLYRVWCGEGQSDNP